MATNYSLLKNSEQQLFDKFKKFINHTLNSWKTLGKTLSKSSNISLKLINEFAEMEDQSNHYEAEILDDSIWIISKNQPVANHLRYIIAILNSITDLERMGDYVMSTARFYYSHKEIDKQMFDLTNLCIKDSIDSVEKIFQSLVSEKAINAYENALRIQKNYQEKYAESMMNLSKILHSKSAKEIANFLTGSIIILKNIERNVDHAMNITENFLYIKQSNFFFDKKSKQIDKLKKT